ncbi:MAG: signal recognition particle-docking protein FtsY [Deltaproteobacteria bacterium]|jgi:fused signal recognition particle receptor|nr:signal recognition particle-docking protein FtsY [Deltaproteobacteria bacterium]MBT4264727.1 signal recognition particle-docking protein FtsY [Deltaproteobacteria bacterium]MBT4640434.1 signal recognition particle-docking protein FtsY [Deltaproteobacteria bacterium]MBT6502893.1 signal recognition particle-docking protein FtsY [Deltaproteobacteria bacterium]MBT6612087.1 signal recognition particle-docking protein FtsY [Deltaproteobacteria bacterium]
MLFNKKKKKEKEEKKRIKKKVEEKTQVIVEQIDSAEKEYQSQQKSLEKEIVLPEQEKNKKSSLFSKFKKGLSKTKQMLVGGLMELSGEEAVDDDFLDDLEERLLASDIGLTTSEKIIQIIKQQVADFEIKSQTEAIETVKSIIHNILDHADLTLPIAASGPTVYLFVGVNGVGKTTSIGKIAADFKQQGKKVLVAAGDTFRAAAIEQLAEWCKRAGVDIIAKEINSDPAATMFEATAKAVSENYDVLLCDTSGRLHTKKNLMVELSKMQNVIKKNIPDAPHASLLVLDANTGQNAINQTREFSSLIGLNGLIITKLDGTAKGGVVIGIVNEFEIPIFYIGVGEGLDDLQPFSARIFADSLFE